MKKETGLKAILADYQKYEENKFTQGLKIRVKRTRQDVLEELGNSVTDPESHLRFLQGIKEGIRRIVDLPNKYKNELEKELEKPE